MADSFKIPGSSYDELIKIIRAYATSKIGMQISLETVAQAAGIDKTIISRNNGFLVQLGLVSEGNKKSLTQLGSDLGRAYTLNVEDQIIRIWKNAVEADEFLSRMLSAIRIRNGMEKSSFINHILYSSGSAANNNSRAGANTIIEIFKIAKLVTEDDGKIIALELDNTVQNDDIFIESNMNIPEADPIQSYKVQRANVTINVNINVSMEDIDVLPDKLKSLISILNHVD